MRSRTHNLSLWPVVDLQIVSEGQAIDLMLRAAQSVMFGIRCIPEVSTASLPSRVPIVAMIAILDSADAKRIVWRFARHTILFASAEVRKNASLSMAILPANPVSFPWNETQ